MGVKELWSLVRDPIMLVLIVYTFSASIYIAATAAPETLHNAPLAIVDEDDSQLSSQIASAFYPPRFNTPRLIPWSGTDPGLDSGDIAFVLSIPPHFQRDVLAGTSPAIQLNVDATRMSQAFTGNGYIQQIAMDEINAFVRRYRTPPAPPVDLVLRARFNPNLQEAWFGALMEIINNVTLLSIILTGAAMIREREHGTIEHLLVMPVSPAEIMLAKVWSMSLVVLAATFGGLALVVQGVLSVPIDGSVSLFLAGVAIHLFATTSIGIWMATLAKSMPQFAMLAVLVLLPLQLLSGSFTPRESMPLLVRDAMLASPTTHFVSLGQAILFRGAGIETVWPAFVSLFGIGVVFFVVALLRFRKTLSQMA
jgi:ABC-2 type transport system permease protein